MAPVPSAPPAVTTQTAGAVAGATGGGPADTLAAAAPTGAAGAVAGASALGGATGDAMSQLQALLTQLTQLISSLGGAGGAVTAGGPIATATQSPSQTGDVAQTGGKKHGKAHKGHGKHKHGKAKGAGGEGKEHDDDGPKAARTSGGGATQVTAAKPTSAATPAAPVPVVTSKPAATKTMSS